MPTVRPGQGAHHSHKRPRGIDPDNHYGDTIVGALYLAQAEALLCKGGRKLAREQRRS
jgi:hypothetical protein